MGETGKPPTQPGYPPVGEMGPPSVQLKERAWTPPAIMQLMVVATALLVFVVLVLGSLVLLVLGKPFQPWVQLFLPVITYLLGLFTRELFARTTLQRGGPQPGRPRSGTKGH